MSEPRPVLDPTRIGQITRGDAALARELLLALVSEGSEVMEQLRVAIAAGEPSAVSGQAHKLKGMATELGAVRLRAAAALLESDGEPVRWATELAAIENALAEVRALAV